MSYKTTVQPHFRQTDMAGILYFNEIHNLFHDSYEEFVEENLSPKADWFQNREWAVPIKKIETEFFLPMLAFEKYQVTISVTNVGSSSFTLKTEFSKENQDYAQILTTHVFIDKASKKSCPLPPIIKDKLQSVN